MALWQDFGGSGTSNDGNTTRRFFEYVRRSGVGSTEKATSFFDGSEDISLAGDLVKKTTRLLQLDKPELKGKAEKLIENFSIILKTLNSGFAIDVNSFKQFCSEAAELYLDEKLFKWYPMPPTVHHRVLIHGAEVIRAAKVPIGALCEEPQGSRNKDIKNYREMRARKCSRYAFYAF